MRYFPILTAEFGLRFRRFCSLFFCHITVHVRRNALVAFRLCFVLHTLVCFLLRIVPPRIRPFEFESAAFAGEPVQLTCFITKGDKPLRISWYLHSRELTSSQTGISTTAMGDRASSLSIAAAGLSNAGNYTCVAQNAAGTDYHSAYLEVNGTAARHPGFDRFPPFTCHTIFYPSAKQPFLRA